MSLFIMRPKGWELASPDQALRICYPLVSSQQEERLEASSQWGGRAATETKGFRRETGPLLRTHTDCDGSGAGATLPLLPPDTQGDSKQPFTR